MGRSLVDVDEEGRLAVHDQLRDLGREIVRQENERPAVRSRVWGVDAIKVIATKEHSEVFPRPADGHLDGIFETSVMGSPAKET
jgi:hypothetical protein